MQNVERVTKPEPGCLKIEDLIRTVARSTKIIDYKKDGISVLIPIGTIMKIDLDLEIALIGADHVFVFSDEYQVIVN